MPLNIDWQQILLHLLNFAILAGGLYLLLYKPVKQFMEDRTAHYRQLEADAQETLRQADREKLEAQKAMASLQEDLEAQRSQAQAALRRDTQRQLEQANRQAELILTQARKNAELQQKKALEDSNREIRELAISAAEKLALQEDPFDQFLRAADGRNGHGDRT